MKEKGLGKVNASGKNSQLIQVAVVCLAATSFFTTAQGMNNYIFQNAPLSYATSAAIQVILLAMSMGLPQYLDAIQQKGWGWFKTKILRAGIVLLTAVVMFCSSWFSYIYIAEVVHLKSWNTESELLVQQTYREKLYESKDYAYAYRVYLENSLGEKILKIQELAQNVFADESLDSLNTNWEEERSKYEEMDDLIAGYMLPVVEAMEKAMVQSPTQNSLDQAAKAIEGAETNITSRKETVQEEHATIENKISQYKNDIANLKEEINKAADGMDITGLRNSYDKTQEAIEAATESRNRLQSEYDQLDKAYSRLQSYKNKLELNNSSSAIETRSQLLALQTEFFSENLDEQNLIKTATDIFKNLRDAATDENGDGTNYTNLLIQMNQLILNLKDYADIKQTEALLDGYISDLNIKRDTKGNTGDKNQDEWKEAWREKLEELKAAIGSVPVFVDTQSTDNEESVSGLTDTQQEVLQSYNRVEASKILDNMIRLYIEDHNALYQGIIYLRSPYRGLAVFSLILAILFDLSGFILGFVEMGDKEPEHENVKNDIVSVNMRNDIVKRTHGEKYDNTPWSIIPTLNKYRILTGDFEKRDKIYSYQVFEDGLLQAWDTEKLDGDDEARIYLQSMNDESKKMMVSEEQLLLFAGQPDGPEDGIYFECSLKFNEGSLLLIKKENEITKETFLANLYEYVPVHNYNASRGECKTIPAQELSEDTGEIKTAVVALNDKGSRVAAIYMITK